MKRNLLIGTSLVAAFATTAVSARSAAVMTEASFNENTDVSNTVAIATEAFKAEFNTKALALKATGGLTLLESTLGTEAGREAVAKILKATTAEDTTADALAAAFGKQTEAQKKATVTAIATALATNAELRKLVNDFRPAVVAAVAAEKKAVVEPGKLVAPAPTPDVTPVVTPVQNNAPVTLATLSQAVSDTTNDLVSAINAEAVAQKAVEDAKADVTALTTAKSDADKALEDAQTALKAAETKAATAKTAADKATADLTALTTEKKAKEGSIATAEKVIADKTTAGTAVTEAETNALNVLKAELATIDAKIVAATATQTNTAAELVAADKVVAADKAAVEVATKAQGDAVTALETAVKAKADADTALTAKTTAVTEVTTKLTTAKSAVLAAAEKAATEAATKATTATEAAGSAEIKRTELATAAETAKARVIELGKRETSLKTELTAARAVDTANSTEATKAAVTAKEAAVIAIAKELAEAKIAATHAANAEKTATEAAAKAEAEATTASESKETAATELEAAKAAVKAADEAVKTARATIVQAAKAAQADAQAAKASSDAKAAVDKVTTLTGELTALEAQLVANPGDATLTKAVADKKVELDQAKKAAETAALASKNATATAAQATTELDAAKITAAQAAAAARTLKTQLDVATIAATEAAEKVKKLEAANSGFANEVSSLTATVDRFNADKVLATIFKNAESELQAAEATRAESDATIKTLLNAITVSEADESAATQVISLAVKLKNNNAGMDFARQYAVATHAKQVEALKAYNKALATANKLSDAAAKAAAITALGDAPVVDARLTQLVDAIDTVAAAELKIETARFVFNKADRLARLMAKAKVEATGKYSGIIAARLNATTDITIASFVTMFNGNVTSIDAVLDESIQSFHGLVREAEGFNTVKDLLDLDVSGSESKDEVLPMDVRNQLIAELQVALTSSVNSATMKEALTLISAMNARFTELTEQLERREINLGSRAFDELGRLQQALTEAFGKENTFVESMLQKISRASQLSAEFARIEAYEAEETARFNTLTESEQTTEVTHRRDQLLQRRAERKTELKNDATRLVAADSDRLVSTVSRAYHAAAAAQVQNLTTEAMTALKAALRAYNTFLTETAKASDISLLDAQTINQVFGDAQALESFKARRDLDLENVANDQGKLLWTVAHGKEAMAKKAKAARTELDLSAGVFDTAYGNASDEAKDAITFLRDEVQKRQRGIDSLSNENTRLATRLAAADESEKAGIQAEIDAYGLEITVLETWLTEKADAIATATTAAGNLVALNANCLALRKELDTLEAENAKTTQAMEADLATFEYLVAAVRQARAANLEKGATFEAELAEAVATILSPVPQVSAKSSEAGSDTDEEAEEAETSSTQSGAPAEGNFAQLPGGNGGITPPMTGDTTVGLSSPNGTNVEPTATAGVGDNASSARRAAADLDRQGDDIDALFADDSNN